MHADIATGAVDEPPPDDDQPSPTTPFTPDLGPKAVYSLRKQAPRRQGRRIGTCPKCDGPVFWTINVPDPIADLEYASTGTQAPDTRKEIVCMSCDYICTHLFATAHAGGQGGAQERRRVAR